MLLSSHGTAPAVAVLALIPMSNLFPMDMNRNRWIKWSTVSATVVSKQSEMEG